MLAITVDTRERRPLLFPSHLPVLQGHPSCRHSTRVVPVAVSVRTLETGDYASEGSPVVVERKGSLQEIQGNCIGDDRPRFLRALDRLAAAAHPILLLEGTPADLLTATPRTPNPHLVMDAFLRDVYERGIRLLVLPTKTIDQRRAAGELVARIFWNSALVHSSQTAPPQKEPAA